MTPSLPARLGITRRFSITQADLRLANRWNLRDGQVLAIYWVHPPGLASLAEHAVGAHDERGQQARVCLAFGDLALDRSDHETALAQYGSAGRFGRRFIGEHGAESAGGLWWCCVPPCVARQSHRGVAGVVPATPRSRLTRGCP